MHRYEATQLWRETLGERRDDPHSKERERLRVAYSHFRESAALLAAEIARDLPEFTVHDVTHLDALWGMADLILGPNAALTPIEAFILGGAFLVHDLGLGVAAYPEGKRELARDTLWRDTVSAVLRRRIGRAPSIQEMDDADEATRFEATGYVLRARHAERAENLLVRQWQIQNGTEFYLMEDADLRRTYGAIISGVAHSHWWELPRVQRELSFILGPSVGFPSTWTADALRLACTLRAADAAQIDARRAPSLLFAVRAPSGVAQDHWAFQNKLHQPQIKSDRLEYTAGEPFQTNEASAWWLCFDTLRMLNRELQQIDSLLADGNKQRFACRGVLGIDDPERLRLYIPTAGWTPIDTRVHISDVASLVRRLGGEQLYGQHSKAPLRELIQNGSDAIRARRIIESLPDNWGRVSVRLERVGTEYSLEVADNGIGMSTAALTRALLDFGASYWDGQLVREELPGVLSAGFQPTGKFGIGFFSVFMWSSRVSVTTRRYDDAHKDTKVLEFANGVYKRPILRPAAPGEFLHEGGTVVRLVLERPPDSEGGLLSTYSLDAWWKLADLVRWLCPAANVDIEVQDLGRKKLAVRAGDWLTIPGRQLLKRLDAPPNVDRPPMEVLERAGRQLRTIQDADGTPLGRAAIFPDPRLYREGVITVGGFRQCELHGVLGILAGVPTRASRDSAVPVIRSDQLASWATEQARILPRDTRKDDLADAVQTILSCRGEASDLPTAYTSAGWLSADEWSTFAGTLAEVLLVDFDAYGLEAVLPHLQLNRNVVIAYESRNVIGGLDGMKDWLGTPPHPWSWWSENIWSPQGRVIGVLAASWKVDLEALLNSIEFLDDEEEPIAREIGILSGKPFVYRAGVISRPKP